ncbi:MAG: serine hydrolase [Azospirillaceae bacterium]|nr:serine hydrolase [Azospirillaceae bacterium]
MAVNRHRLFLATGTLALLLAGTAAGQTMPPQPSPPNAQLGPVCPIPVMETPLPSHPPSNALPYRPFPPAWQAQIDQLVASDTIPGAVIIVKSPVWGVRVGTTGYSNLPLKIKPNPGQQFRVGSVSKMFLAQEFLQLEQAGLVKLSDPVLKYLGDDPVIVAIPNIKNITIAELLQHTSGIASYTADPTVANSFYVTPNKQYTPNELMATLDPGSTPVLPPDFAPGATYPNPYWVTLGKSAPPAPAPYPWWFYSNSNYILLGMIAERLTKMPAAEILRHYVTDKAGLKDTFLAENEKRLPYMHGYSKYEANLSSQIYDHWCDVTAVNPSAAWTAGAVISTPWDLLKFAETVFKTDTFLNEGTKLKWLSFVSADIHYGWEPMEYGVGGIMEPHRAYGDFRGHGGAFLGYKTLVYYFWDSDTYFILASNTWDGEAENTMLNNVMPFVVGPVTTPKPRNLGSAALGRPRTLAVSWQAGRYDALSYRVYNGVNHDQVDGATAENHPGVQVQDVPGVNAVLRDVRPAAANYWRVDIVSAQGVVPGPVWQFHAAGG